MRSLLIGALLVMAMVDCRAPKWRELSNAYTFDDYSRDFGRRYPKGSQQYITRKSIFDQNLNDILQHNADGSQTYKKGVNQFTDWSADEFKNYNRLRVNHQTRKSLSTYSAQSSATTSLPASVDYRKNVEPRVISAVKNQGACGNCWSHSATESVESYFAIATGQLPTLSVQQITSCTTEDYGCGGGDFFDGWAYLSTTTGLNEQWLYPFTDFFAANESKAATSPCKNITQEFLPGFPWYPKANVTNATAINENDAHSMLSALANIGPQSIAVAASLWGSYEGGIYQNNGTNPANYEIDHAVQLVGYGFDFDTGLNYWIVRNSWGTTWGEAGYIRLARPKVEPCGVDIYANATVCGTSGLLCCGGYPSVTTLNTLNV